MSEKPLSERMRIAGKTAELGDYPTAAMCFGWVEEAEQMERIIRGRREWGIQPREVDED